MTWPQFIITVTAVITGNVVTGLWVYFFTVVRKSENETGGTDAVPFWVWLVGLIPFGFIITALLYLPRY